MPIEVESPEQMGYETIRHNLSESSFTDARLRDIHPAPDIQNLLLCYGSHAGHEGLRDAIVAGTSLSREDVLLTMGAAGALFIVATSLLEKDDELIVVHPNYATNLETPRAIGAVIRPVDLPWENAFRLDIVKIGSMINGRTRFISVTTPHNPTGVCLGAGELQQLANLAAAHGIYLLVDETYRDMSFGNPPPLAATLSPRVISISSLSKTYGLPGLRTGWLICGDRRLMATFLAAKEQIHICGPVIDEAIAFGYWQERGRRLPAIRAAIAEKFGIVSAWMREQDQFEWIPPAGGCVCFPRIRQPEKGDLAQFYRRLLEEFGTYVGRGHWFDMPDQYFRIGYGWPHSGSLQQGLRALTQCWEAVRRY